MGGLKNRTSLLIFCATSAGLQATLMPSVSIPHPALCTPLLSTHGPVWEKGRWLGARWAELFTTSTVTCTHTVWATPSDGHVLRGHLGHRHRQHRPPCPAVPACPPRAGKGRFPWGARIHHPPAPSALTPRTWAQVSAGNHRVGQEETPRPWGPAYERTPLSELDQHWAVFP